MHLEGTLPKKLVKSHIEFTKRNIYVEIINKKLQEGNHKIFPNIRMLQETRNKVLILIVLFLIILVEG